MDPAPDCTLIVPDARVFCLHSHCLAARSALLGNLLSGVSPLDLPFRIPRNRLPRLLPSPPDHPVLFLPVPDPSSIHLLFQWIYSGNTSHLQTALDSGLTQWQGLARNVEYLGLHTDIKVFLGRWYRNWLLPARQDDTEQSDSDSECDDSEDNYPYPDDDLHSDDRGRSRSIKPLLHLCAQFRLFTT